MVSLPTEETCSKQSPNMSSTDCKSPILLSTQEAKGCQRCEETGSNTDMKRFFWLNLCNGTNPWAAHWVILCQSASYILQREKSAKVTEFCSSALQNFKGKMTQKRKCKQRNKGNREAEDQPSAPQRYPKQCHSLLSEWGSTQRRSFL